MLDDKILFELGDYIRILSNHIGKCENCKIKGNICPICKKNEVIHSYQSNIMQCPICLV